MPIDRRTVLLAGAGALIAQGAAAKSIEDHGLFWSVTPQGKPAAVLFGYARTAAQAAPALVQQGVKLGMTCAAVYGDVPNTKLPPMQADPSQLTEVFDRVPPALAQRIHAYLGQLYPTMPPNLKFTGLMVAMILQGEGQVPPQVTVGGTIAEVLVKAGKPIDYLLTPQQYESTFHLPTLAEADKRVTPEVIDYLFAQRDKVGPIGKYQQDLYTTGRVGELSAFDDDMKAHGVPSFQDLGGIDAVRLQGMIVDRALTMLGAATAPLFMMIPVGTLTETDGVLARAAAEGMAVKPIA